MFIGIDCSTQSLKLQIINELKQIVQEVVVNYDQDLPHYSTTNGIVRHTTANHIEHISTPTILFVEALEQAIAKLKNENNFDLSTVKGISGSGQQHGSVWWKQGSLDLLRKINNNTDQEDKLFHLLSTTFSLPLSPIWMDSSTSVECEEITNKIGSAQALANTTGSRAYERFTGPQIKHVYKHQPDVYQSTERISLISSFLACLLIGEYAPIDFSDGSGMNLLDIHTQKWSQDLLDICAPDLREKLGEEPVESNSLVGLISTYWCRKYGFSNDCRIYAFSGDNPCSLIGLGLNRPGDIGLSLGTSDVLFAVTDDPKPNANEGSILIHPENSDNFMMMLVYKNGATTREHIRDLADKSKSWESFNTSIRSTTPGNNGCLGFYFLESEITPNVFRPGIVKFDENDQVILKSGIGERDCRGIVEAQVLSYKYHAQLLGLSQITSIVVTGGGSVNGEILQIVADIFEMDVHSSSIVNTAASGAAIRALNAYMRNQSNGLSDAQHVNQVVKAREENFSVYRQLFSRFARLEAQALEILSKKLY